VRLWGNLHYIVESVTDNTLKKFFQSKNGREKVFLCHRLHDRHEKLNPHRMCVITPAPDSIYSLHSTRRKLSSKTTFRKRACKTTHHYDVWDEPGWKIKKENEGLSVHVQVYGES
jgi:hypothetical protein